MTPLTLDKEVEGGVFSSHRVVKYCQKYMVQSTSYLGTEAQQTHEAYKAVAGCPPTTYLPLMGGP